MEQVLGQLQVAGRDRVRQRVHVDAVVGENCKNLYKVSWTPASCYSCGVCVLSWTGSDMYPLHPRLFICCLLANVSGFHYVLPLPVQLSRHYHYAISVVLCVCCRGLVQICIISIYFCLFVVSWLTFPVSLACFPLQFSHRVVITMILLTYISLYAASCRRDWRARRASSQPQIACTLACIWPE